jgi:hypothetical protein
MDRHAAKMGGWRRAPESFRRLVDRSVATGNAVESGRLQSQDRCRIRFPPLGSSVKETDPLAPVTTATTRFLSITLALTKIDSTDF